MSDWQGVATKASRPRGSTIGMESRERMGWAEMGLLLADLLRSWGEEVGSARSVSSLGGRTFRPEKPAWGFPMPLQYYRPLGFGNWHAECEVQKHLHIHIQGKL